MTLFKSFTMFTWTNLHYYIGKDTRLMFILKYKISRIFQVPAKTLYIRGVSCCSLSYNKYIYSCKKYTFQLDFYSWHENYDFANHADSWLFYIWNASREKEKTWFVWLASKVQSIYIIYIGHFHYIIFMWYTRDYPVCSASSIHDTL